MNSLLLFLLKSTLSLSFLYIAYRLLMRRETFFKLNRMVLLFTVLYSMVIPFLYSPKLFTVQAEFEPVFQNVIISELPVQASDEPITATQLQQPVTVKETDRPVSLSASDILTIVYLSGVFVSLLLMAYSISAVLLLFRKARKTQLNGIRLMIVGEEIPAFSFGRNILISQNDYENNYEAILTHEQSHIRLGHFYDLMLMELVKIIFWFNPLVYRIMRDLKEIHEFQADNHALNSGIDATKYQLLIIKKSVGPQKFALANSFNHCQIKNRIVMMNKSKTGKAWRWKVATFLPLLALLLMAFGRTGENVPPEKENLHVNSLTEINQNQNEQKSRLIEVRKDGNYIDNKLCSLEETIAKGKEWGKASNDWIQLRIDESVPYSRTDEILEQLSLGMYHITLSKVNSDDIVYFAGDVSQSAKFTQGKREDWMKTRLNQLIGDKFPRYNIDYSFIVDKTGKVMDAHIVKPSEYSEVNSAYEKILTQMPNWEPAKKMGKTVSVYYVMRVGSISFTPPKIIPPILIEIKKEGIFLMQKLVTLDEFRKQLPLAVKNNPQSEVMVNIIDAFNSALPVVRDIINNECDSKKVKYIRFTQKFTPPQTSDIKIPKRNTFSMQVDAKGKVFVGFDGQDNKRMLLTRMGEDYNIVFSPKELEEFSKIDNFGVPINRMKAFLKMSAEERDKPENAIGIPYDSGNNEFKNWVRTARSVNKDMHITIKGDQTTSYQVINQLIETLKDLHENRLYMALAEWDTAYEIAFPSKDEQKGAVKKFTQSAALDYARNNPRAITVIPDKDNSIYYYLGTQDTKGNNPVLTKTDFSPSGIHELLKNMNHDVLAKVEDLRKKKQDLSLSEEDFEKQRHAILSDKTATIVLIKPTGASTYGSLMNILDEMVICSIGRYAIIDLSDYDKELINKTRL